MFKIKRIRADEVKVGMLYLWITAKYSQDYVDEMFTEKEQNKIKTLGKTLSERLLNPYTYGSSCHQWLIEGIVTDVKIFEEDGIKHVIYHYAPILSGEEMDKDFQKSGFCTFPADDNEIYILEYTNE